MESECPDTVKAWWKEQIYWAFPADNNHLHNPLKALKELEEFVEGSELLKPPMSIVVTKSRQCSQRVSSTSKRIFLSILV